MNKKYEEVIKKDNLCMLLENLYFTLDYLLKSDSPKLKEAAKLCKSILEDATK